MRQRVWWLVGILGTVALILLAMAGDPEFDYRYTGGNWGYLWLIVGWNIFWWMSYAGILVIRNSSPKAFSDVISTTISSTARSTHPIPELRTKDGRVAYPEMEVIVLGGGGPIAGISVPGGGEYGFALVRKGLVVEVQGNLFINAYTHPYYPGSRMFWRWAAPLLPDIFDERLRLPTEWLDHLRNHHGLKESSIIYVAEVPLFPFIRFDERAGKEGKRGVAEIDLPGHGRKIVTAPAGTEHILFNFEKKLSSELAGEFKARNDYHEEKHKALQEENDLYRRQQIRMRAIMDTWQAEDSGLKARLEELLGREQSSEQGG